jgi:hypothetical protein
MQDILLTTVSLALGGLIGFLTSSYFYKKTQPFEREMHRLSSTLEQIYFQTKFPSIFDNTAYKKEYYTKAPKNTDIPHLWHVRCENSSVARGKNLLIIFQVRDNGNNFSLVNGTELRNNLNQYNIPITYEGFAWLSATVPIPKDAPLGVHKLRFTMTDSKKNIGTGEFEYTVMKS